MAEDAKIGTDDSNYDIIVKKLPFMFNLSIVVDYLTFITRFAFI